MWWDVNIKWDCYQISKSGGKLCFLICFWSSAMLEKLFGVGKYNCD